MAPVGRVLAILLVVGQSACVSPESREAVRILEDIQAGTGASGLKDRTPTPTRRESRFAVGGRAGLADIYRPGEPAGGALVLVPGFTEHGKNDARIVALAHSFARGRFIVLVPDLAGSRDLRVDEADARQIGDAVVHLASLVDGDLPIGVGAISYAVGPAIRAGLMTDSGPLVDFIVGLGAYYDARAVITYITTGRYRGRSDERWRVGAPYPESKWIFLANNLDALESESDQNRLRAIADAQLADPSTPAEPVDPALGAVARDLLALITNDDPDRVADLIAALPRDFSRRIEAFSLSKLDLSPLAGRLILIHGRADRLIPATESRALADAAGDADLFLIPGFSHIDTRAVGLRGKLRLIDAMQAILARRRFPRHAP